MIKNLIDGAGIYEIDKKKLIETDCKGYVRILNFDGCLFGACLFGEHYLKNEGKNQRLKVFDLLNETKVLEIDGKFNDKVITVLSIEIDSIGLCFFANDGNYH
jgi:hypothetical protein